RSSWNEVIAMMMPIGFRFVVMAISLTWLLAKSAQAVDDLNQLRVSPDGRFLMQPDGSPFFWLADTGWSMFQRLDRDDAEHYLADRAKKGYNMIQAVVLGGPVDPITVPNRYGHLPFIDGDPARPNPKYFEHVDWLVERATQHGLRIA